MRILFTTAPGMGHLHPMVPFAKALQDAGHEVAFASAESFRPIIEKLGFKAFASGLDWLESQAELTFPELSSMPLEQQQLWFFTEIFANVAAQRMLPDLLARCESWQPDLIVRNDYEFAGCVAAECFGIPHAAIGLDLFLSQAVQESLIGPQLSRLREAAGLSPHSPMEMLYRYLYLSLMPPGYQFADMLQVPVAHALRPSNFDRSVSDELPQWLNQLPPRPTVYATLGTVFNRVPEIFRTIIEGLRDEPLNLIMTVGAGQDAAQFAPLPANIYVETYIPQSLLFPRCEMVILNGSCNTVISALSYGLPLLLIPMGSTQPLHAMRCATLGVGCVLKPRGLFDGYLYNRAYAELSPEAVRVTVKELLQNPSYRQSAQRLRQEMQSLPGTERAVELLLKLAAEKTPQFACAKQMRDA